MPETIDCSDPKALAEAAACYCYDDPTQRRVTVYLLAQIAGLGAMTPAELARESKCLCGIPQKEMDQVIAWLLCQNANLA